MPSSTDRGSAQEHELFEVYVTISARLWQADCRKMLDKLTHMFADLLDTDYMSLVNEGVAMVDWQKEVDGCKRYRASANVTYANNMLESMGWTLMKTYGREADAVPCFRFAHMLYDIAVRLYDGEQAAAEERRLRDAHHSVKRLSR